MTAISIQPQLALFLDNRPGILAKTCQVLADAKISIMALSILDTADNAIVRMVVDRPKEAEAALARLNIPIQRRDVVCMNVVSQVGALASITDRLARAGINLEYAYCTTPASHSEGAIVLRTNDLEATINALS